MECLCLQIHVTVCQFKNERLGLLRNTCMCVSIFVYFRGPNYSNIIVSQPVVVTQMKPLPQWANGFEKEVEIQCQYCKHPIITIPKKEIGKGSLICTLILCVTVPILFCLPLLKESCKDVVHICPICGHNVGVKQYKPCS